MTKVHVCDESCLFTNRDFTTVCKVTGRCYNQYINSNVFYNDAQSSLIPVGNKKREMLDKARETTNLPNKTTKRKRKKKAHYLRPKPHFDCEVVRSNIHRTVCSLLYSQHRETADAFNIRENIIDTNADSRRHHYKKRRSVLKVKYDETIVSGVVDDVYGVVRMVYNQRPFLKIIPIVIGSLYLMQHGKRFRSFEIKQNEYLYRHLPSVSDLPNFSFQKNMVRIGSNVIIRCARSL